MLLYRETKKNDCDESCNKTILFSHFFYFVSLSIIINGEYLIKFCVVNTSISVEINDFIENSTFLYIALWLTHQMCLNFSKSFLN